MEKCCIICGKPLDEGLTHCPHCGCCQDPAPEVAAPLPMPTEVSAPEEAPAKPSFQTFLRKIPKVVYLLAAVFLVLAVTAVVFFNRSTPQKALNDYAAVMNGNIYKISNLLPEDYWGRYTSVKNPTEADVLRSYQQAYQQNREKVIHDRFALQEPEDIPVVRYKILEEAPVAAEELALINSSMSKYLAEGQPITEALQLTVWIHEQAGACERHDIRTIFAVQINGRWYLVRNSTFPNFYFDATYSP